MEYDCFREIKEMIYPIASQVYHRLTVKLFPYINNILNQNNFVLEENVFNKLQIRQYVNISLDFVINLLLLENRIKNNLDDNNLDPNQMLQEISIIKNKLKKLIKNFFGLLIDVIEKKIFSINIDPNGNNQLDINADGLNNMIIEKLNRLNALYLKIFELEKKFDSYINPQQPVKEADNQHDDCGKYILDLLTTKTTANDIESNVLSIENADKYIATSKETTLQKISRIFTNIPKHKQEILAIILDQKELTFTVEELIEWEALNQLANQAPKDTKIKEDFVALAKTEEVIEEGMITGKNIITEEFYMIEDDKEATKQRRHIAELAESRQNTNDISLESSEQTMVEDALADPREIPEMVEDALVDPEEILKNDDYFIKAVFFNSQGSFFVHSPYYYPNCEFKEQEYSPPTRHTNKLMVS